MEWIDLALMEDERTLSGAIQKMSSAELSSVLAAAADEIRMSREDLDRATLRLLIERLRPLALPTALWSRPITASNDPQVLIQAHFAKRGLSPTAERLRQANRLYVQFAEERRKVPVREQDLKRCGYRCEHCGLAFCNEELSAKAFVSPFGLRGVLKTDRHKPHWNGPIEMRQPTMDHDWPVSLYGDNTSSNLRVLCKACNQGKANLVALEQTASWVGLPPRDQLLGSDVVSMEIFYAQLRRAPRCHRTGSTRLSHELTIELIDLAAPAVLDNLQTVASAGD